MSQRRFATLAVASGLIATYLFSVAVKVRHTASLDRYSTRDDVLLFKAESAMQYRYAKMISSGHKLPALDTTVQHPEGLALFNELTVGMEYFAGLSYRLLGKAGFHPPFHVFLTLTVILYSSLLVFLLYAVTYQLSRDRGLALAAAAFYAVLPAGMGRAVGSYSLEDFSIPIIFAGLYALFGAFSSPSRRGLAAAAGVLLALSLATWHFSKFFLTVLVAVLAVLASWREDWREIERPWTIITAILLAAGVLSPVLRHQSFALSTPMLVSYGLLAALWFSKTGHLKGRWRFVLCLGAVAAFGFLASYPVQKRLSAEYAHVFSLFVHKLSSLFVKPDDPSALDLEARMLWIEDFNSPTVIFALFTMSSLLIAGAASLGYGVRLLWKGRLTAQQATVVLLGIAFFVGALIVKRLFVFQAPLLCLALAVWAHASARLRRVVLVALLAIIPLEGLATAQYYFFGRGPKAVLAAGQGQVSPDPTSDNFHLSVQDEYRELLDWIKERTEPSDVFLTGIGTSAEIWAYTDRSVNLHPKFEAKRLRDKVGRFMLALFQPEDRLFKLCQEWETGYLVYKPEMALGRSKDSYRYQADSLALSTSSAAFLLQFAPERLSRFELVYENSGFRVFRVTTKARHSELSQMAGRSEPVFDLSRYTMPSVEGVFRDAAAAPVLAAIHASNIAAQNGYALAAKGSADKAIGQFEVAVKDDWMNAGVLTSLAQLYLNRGDMAAANERLKEAVALNPQHASAIRLLGCVQFARGDQKAAEISFRKALWVRPGDAIASNDLAVILFLSGRRQEAGRLLRRASELAPQNVQIARNYGIVAQTIPAGPLDFIFPR